MDIHNIVDGGNMLFIPDYFVNPLKRTGLDVRDLTPEMVTDLVDTVTRGPGVSSSTLPTATHNITLSDINDLLSLNEIIYRLLFNANIFDDLFLLGSTCSSIFSESKRLELINHFTTIDDSKEDTHTVVTNTNLICVIVHQGFMTDIVSTDVSVRRALSTRLMDYMFNGLGEQTTVNSALFAEFTRLK